MASGEDLPVFLWVVETYYGGLKQWCKAEGWDWPGSRWFTLLTKVVARYGSILQFKEAHADGIPR